MRHPVRAALVLLTALTACGDATGPGIEAPRFLVQSVIHLQGFEATIPWSADEEGRIAGYAGPEPFSGQSIPILVEADDQIRQLSLGELPGFAIGLGPSGEVLGDAGREAVLWNGSQRIVLPKPQFAFSGSAHAMSPTGLIVGSAGDSDQIGPHHVYWPDASSEPVLLQGLFEGNHLGSAWDVNAVGQIAGVSGGFIGEFFAVRWDDPAVAPAKIGPLPGAFNSEARAINGLGDVVGRSSFPDFSIQAFLHRRDSNALIGLRFLPGQNRYAEAFDINDSRWVVGTAGAGPNVVHGVLWAEGRVYDLNELLVGSRQGVATITSAVAVSQDGRIVAKAFLSGGEIAIVRLSPQES